MGVILFSSLIAMNYYLNIPQNREQNVEDITLIIDYASVKPIDRWDNFSLFDYKTTVIYALLEKRDVKMTGTPESNAFVQAINGVEQYKDKSGYFWLFFVNGKQSGIGSSLYVLSNGDVIWWNYTNSF